MTKSELKTGMIVTTQDGMEYVVFRNVQYLFENPFKSHNGEIDDVLVNAQRNTWNRLEYYNEDLTYKSDGLTDIFAKRNEIVKVEIPYHPYAFMNIDIEKHRRKLIWKREIVKEITMADVEEQFGCKVKIIG